MPQPESSSQFDASWLNWNQSSKRIFKNIIYRRDVKAKSEIAAEIDS